MPFRLEPDADPLFSQRLVLAPSSRDRWIVLAYRQPACPRPLRPMIRLHRSGGRVQDFVLPGDGVGAALWLGHLPRDVGAIGLAAEPGFVLERVGVRSLTRLLGECAVRRPLRALAALYHRGRGDERRFRDILRGACAVTPMDRYPAWKAARTRAGDAATTPDLAIRLVLPARPSQAEAVAATVAGLRAQTHAAWRLHLAWDPTAPARIVLPDDPRIEAVSWDAHTRMDDLRAGADALGWLAPGDVLSPDALAILAGALSGASLPDLAYADEESGPLPSPRLKPDWSPDLALVTGYLGRPVLLGRPLAAYLADRPAGPFEAFPLDWELAAIAEAKTPVHVPRILARTEAGGGDTETRAGALDRHLEATGARARVRRDGASIDLHWPRPEPPPLVSLVIPSRDRLDLIARVLDGVLRGTAYPNLEVIVVDNGSTDPAVLRLYETLRADPRVRIEPYPHPFNFSALVNAGVRQARGTILVLLNNDVAVLDPTWLDALVGQACRPEVGAVGAKLLYEDGRLQHAGVVVGLGGRAGHILRRRSADTPGHLGRMRVAHEVAAVTAACLAVAREKYEAVGGFDAQTFPIDFNDVDFCLRLAAAGWKTMWTPHAVLSHLESVSRGPPVGAARQRFEREAEAFAQRWRDTIRHDPFYHPALSLTTFGEDLE